MNDIRNFHRAFYSIPEKEKQDAFLLKYCKSENPKRCRVSPDQKKKNKNVSVKYTIENQVGNKLPVCRDTFLNVLQITRHRVLGIFLRFKGDATMIPVETRGGSRKEHLFADKRNAVIAYIKKLKMSESHYNRNKSTRMYLPSELSIAKLSRAYNEENPGLKVKESYFRHIFVTHFNISFRMPAVDECSTCLELGEKLKAETDEAERSALNLKLTLHKKLAANFFKFQKEKPDDCFLMCFDCQKNLPLPKVSDQSAYYSRQLYCYNMSVVKGLSTGVLDPTTVSIYTWTENEGKKSSNEIASIILNELGDCLEELKTYSSIRLVCDGCPGQNKNVNVLTALMVWLSKAPDNITSIDLLFPVTGHSFMAADRVFGLIEKDIRRKKAIIDVNDYHEIFQRYGTIKKMGVHWKSYDWRKMATKFTKSSQQLHFKISKCRRIMLRRSCKSKTILFRGQQSYNWSDGMEMQILKKNAKIENIRPPAIPVGVPVNALKLRDVEALLSKHFGEEWRNLETLKWYVDVTGGKETVEDEDQCECMESPEIFDEEPDMYSA